MYETSITTRHSRFLSVAERQNVENIQFRVNQTSNSHWSAEVSKSPAWCWKPQRDELQTFSGQKANLDGVTFDAEWKSIGHALLCRIAKALNMRHTKTLTSLQNFCAMVW